MIPFRMKCIFGAARTWFIALHEPYDALDADGTLVACGEQTRLVFQISQIVVLGEAPTHKETLARLAGVHHYSDNRNGTVLIVCHTCSEHGELAPGM